MLDMNGYMKKVGVTKKKYVTDWLAKDLIPGALQDEATGEYSFPESARRPYRCSSLKANTKAPQIRAHIVKACINRQHITKDMCFMSEGEFNGMIDDLVNAGWIRRRVEDEITYYDSTERSDTYSGQPLKELVKILNSTLSVVAEAAARGTVTVMLA
ncbi:MAG: hypothetical protein NC489_19150 [Ruminococcus flavefaciens]|nr:hypothetical protein [Ruminococcus flavefaciens]